MAFLFDNDFRVTPDPDNTRPGFVKYTSSGDDSTRIQVWCSRTWLGAPQPSSFTVSFRKNASGDTNQEFPLVFNKEGPRFCQYDSPFSGDERDITGVYVPVGSAGDPPAQRMSIRVRE